LLSTASKAVIEELNKRKWPVVTSYELFRLVWLVYKHPENFPIKIRKKTDTAEWLQYHKVLTELTENRFIRPDVDFRLHSPRFEVFRVADVPDAPAEDIFCLVDPFAAVAYLSALQRYGLTVRQPKALSMMTPDPRSWQKRSSEKQLQDYGFDPADADLKYFVPLTLPKFPERLRDREITVHRPKTEYPLQPISDSFARIIEVGNLFVQTLEAPDLCGGIEHVLEVWDEHADTSYLELIILAVNEAPSAIVKVRAGYILTERLQIADPRIEAWKRFAQRGGSRKLDPSKPYAPTFSEAWMLSLNA
jgi:hypothetical protein